MQKCAIVSRSKMVINSLKVKETKGIKKWKQFLNSNRANKIKDNNNNNNTVIATATATNNWNIIKMKLEFNERKWFY